MNKTAILRNIQNGNIYRHIKDNLYRNLSTGAEGEIPPETATKFLKLNVEASLMLNKHPNIEVLINKLNLKFEKL